MNRIYLDPDAGKLNIMLKSRDKKVQATAKNKIKIMELEAKLKALHELRNSAFINMKKIDAYDGEMEIQAIDDIFEMGIEIFNRDQAGHLISCASAVKIKIVSRYKLLFD